MSSTDQMSTYSQKDGQTLDSLEYTVSVLLLFYIYLFIGKIINNKQKS